MSEQKIGCVPDGYMPIPTAEQIADALDGVRCYHDMSAELIAPRLLANLLAVTTVKTETCEALADKRNFGTPAPFLPAAGSTVEEVEVVAWVTPEKDRAITALTEAAAREDGGAMLSSVRPYSVPCMTVDQCLRMLDQLRAALSAQQSAHVCVPRELLERVATHLEWDGDESQTVIQYANKCDALAAELSALLRPSAEHYSELDRL